jgi:4-diphosphocytidyl-2-C-methyl-D-erythritol kinase
MVVYPNCKINLGLNVISRRSDGFHDIESIFYPVPWFDILEIAPSVKNNFVFKGTTINCSKEENLCFKAYQIIKSQYNIPDINLYLYKRIPFGAGLGGGSSDGSYTLRALNELFSLNIDEKNLGEMASFLGSDCAFFTQDKACYISGTGTTFSPFSFSLKGYFLVIIKPDIIIPTKDAYKMITPKKPVMPLTEIIKLPVSNWKELLINDFEKPIFSLYPKIKTIKNSLCEKGAIFASMSGSGSAVYGLFENDINIAGVYSNCTIWKGPLS